LEAHTESDWKLKIETKRAGWKSTTSIMSKKDPPPSCPICLTHYTSVIRQPIQCPYCPASACRQCTSQYLLSSLNNPHCLACKREWNREFIDTKLTQTFRKGSLRQHRRSVLIDREKGRLPAMQTLLEARKEYDDAEALYHRLRRRRVELKRQREEIQRQHVATDTQEQLAARLAPINRERAELKVRKAAALARMDAAQLILTGRQREVRQFIMKCPSDECRGFLSSAWKCGVCQKFFCSDCHVEKAGQKDEEHTCNADAKATAAMIRQETKACPKCGIRISKIDGCDQMWCVSCQTTFSWNTGQILMNTVVHNPHYYEYLRRANNGVIPREAGDVPCGGLPNAYMLTRIVMAIPTLRADEKTEILDVMRCLSDIQYVRLPQFPLQRPANVNQELDIRYLMNEITEEEWGTTLERGENKFEQKKEIGLILQTLIHIGAEKMTQLQNNGSQPNRGEIARSALLEMRNVRDYTNKCLKDKGLLMGMVVPKVTPEWRWDWVRRADMKSDESSAPVELATLAAGGSQVTPQEDPDTYHEEEEEKIMVDFGDEVIEMNLRDAQALVHLRPVGNV